MKAIRLALVAFVLVSLKGCSAEEPQASSLNQPTNLIYWPAPNAQEIQLADTLVRFWNRVHPQSEIRMQPIPVSQSTEEVLLAAIAGKTTPDVCSNIWPGALHDYTTAGGLIPLDTFPDFDSIAASRIPRELLETFRSQDGHFYQLPWKTNPIMMFYNKRLFEEAGIHNIPRTYSEYLAAARHVTRDVNGDGQIDVWMGERDIRPIWWQRLFDFYPFYIAATGGKTLFDYGEPAFVNDAAEKVFAFFQECYTQRYFPRTFFQGGDPFLLEKKATHFGGPWHVAHLQKFAPHISYGIAPLPISDSYQGIIHTYGDYKNIAIFSNTRSPQKAWEFVKFLVDAQSDLLLLEITNQIPIRGDLLTNSLFTEYFRRNPQMVVFAQQAPYTRGVDGVPDLKEIFDAISQSYEACAIYGKRAPREALEDAAERVRSIMEWNK